MEVHHSCTPVETKLLHQKQASCCVVVGRRMDKFGLPGLKFGDSRAADPTAAASPPFSQPSGDTIRKIKKKLIILSRLTTVINFFQKFKLF